jgi:hypothetical protein
MADKRGLKRKQGAHPAEQGIPEQDNSASDIVQSEEDISALKAALEAKDKEIQELRMALARKKARARTPRQLPFLVSAVEPLAVCSILQLCLFRVALTVQVCVSQVLASFHHPPKCGKKSAAAKAMCSHTWLS